MTGSAVLATVALEQRWPTLDPFLFCVHHDDAYPGGNADMGVDGAALAGRDIGMDFSGTDGWSMYHGDAVPGFPRHPHRGFETVTIARRGFIDHADSLGATARFGHGDVQWMTAGRGIVHAEMFPLLERNAANPTELFQIWLNLPARQKMAEPHFAMLWSEDLPHRSPDGAHGVEVVTVAGALDGVVPPPPPPASWAAEAGAAVLIWTVRMAAGARWTLPPAPAGVNRVAYFFAGTTVRVDDQPLDVRHAAQLAPQREVTLICGDAPGELLLLQGRPIGEPVVQHGPFVMNADDEIRQAVADYQASGFGGWPWDADGPVHPRDSGRFARRPDGRIERPRRPAA